MQTGKEIGKRYVDPLTSLYSSTLAINASFRTLNRKKPKKPFTYTLVDLVGTHSI